MIDGKTRVCCLIGNPVGHSLSPMMHNSAFKELGLNFVYVAFRVEKKLLQKAIEGIRSLNIRGMNVTIPHKISVIGLLDEIHDLASEIGAVNTIVNNNGKLKGFNTDGMGALKALRDSEGEPKGKKIVIIGAGGASRAISYFIAKENPRELVIINRTEEKATELARNIKEKLDVNTTSLSLTQENLKSEIKDADILINTTSVGMSPRTNETVISKEILHSDLLLMDLVYNPLETRLIREAKEMGVKTVSGAGMLINQGAAAFEMWTSKKAPIDIMRKAVIETLEGM